MEKNKSDIEPKWEYLVIQINIDNQASKTENITNPQAASDKLKGSLSADFLKKEFPGQYKDQSNQQNPQSNSQNAAFQLQSILNKVGANGWELVESTNLASLFIFIFKKQKTNDVS